MTSYGFFDAKKVGEQFDREYHSTDLTDYFSLLTGSGVSAVYENGDGYKPTRESGMRVSLNPGFAWIEGYYVKDTTKTILSLNPAHSSKFRIDAIVLRLDKLERRVDKVVLEGTPSSSSPPVPALSRTTDIHDIMIGYITLNPGVTSIDSEMITDTRPNPDYCGFIDSFSSRGLPPGAVTSEKIATGAVTSEKIATGAVTSEKIAKHSIRQDNLSFNIPDLYVVLLSNPDLNLPLFVIGGDALNWTPTNYGIPGFPNWGFRCELPISEKLNLNLAPHRDYAILKFVDSTWSNSGGPPIIRYYHEITEDGNIVVYSNSNAGTAIMNISIIRNIDFIPLPP